MFYFSLERLSADLRPAPSSLLFPSHVCGTGSALFPPTLLKVIPGINFAIPVSKTLMHSHTFRVGNFGVLRLLTVNVVIFMFWNEMAGRKRVKTSAEWF